VSKNAVSRAIAGKNVASFFTEEYFNHAAKEMQSGRSPAKRLQHADDLVTGLRVQIFPSNIISYHVQFYVGDQRPFMLIGYANKDNPMYLTVQEAREIAKTIIALGNKGINPQDGLLPRLIRELKKEGEKWRPR
jgi:hypothetical protein